jgi:hypothetical protein
MVSWEPIDHILKKGHLMPAATMLVSTGQDRHTHDEPS